MKEEPSGSLSHGWAQYLFHPLLKVISPPRGRPVRGGGSHRNKIQDYPVSGPVYKKKIQTEITA
jgi:hypothetical protein